MTVAPPQKHYKIVFIKAPTQPIPTVPTIPVQPLDEEKTLVYVLVKKPEDPPKLVIPTPPSTPPSKPEVYFIRYKTQVKVKDESTSSAASELYLNFQNEENSGPYPASNSPTLGPPLASYGAPGASNRADTQKTTPETSKEYQ